MRIYSKLRIHGSLPPQLSCGVKLYKVYRLVPDKAGLTEDHIWIAAPLLLILPLSLCPLLVPERKIAVAEVCHVDGPGYGVQGVPYVDQVHCGAIPLLFFVETL